MYRVYIGNLIHGVTEDTLRTVFDEQGLTVSSVLVKRGYGFVDCPNQNTFDQTIDRLNGYNLLGSVLQVEPSTVSKRRRSNKIQIRNFPQHVTKEDIEQLIAAFGTAQHCDIVSTSVEKFVTVVYETSEEAQKAVAELNNLEFQGSILRVEVPNSGATRGREHVNGGGTDNVNTNYVLRMLVPSSYIGAIIGKKGETVRRITTDSGVFRVDIHGKEQVELIEKIVAVTGKPEAVSHACKDILYVMQQESTKSSLGEVMLKVLAEDRCCGRVIGKEGTIIKKIREQTDTKIIVSNAQEMMALYPERIITIRGAIESLSLAEEAISAILRESYEKDVQQGLIPFANSPMISAYRLRMRPLGFSGVPSFRALPKSRSDSDMNGPSGALFFYISVPSSAVGAIIGTAGSNIKQIMRKSGAYVSIEPKKDSEPNPPTERSVTVKGSSDAIWKASYFIFDSMRRDGFTGNDDIRLRTFMKVPKFAAGRIIGKSGKNARDIEHLTGAIVRVTEDSRAHDDEIMVEIFGNFMATQGAVSRIRRMLIRIRPQSTAVSEPVKSSDSAVAAAVSAA